MKKGLNYKELFLRQKSGSLIECFPSFQDTPGSIPSLSQEGGGPNRTSFVQYRTLELERWLLEAPAALPDDLIPFNGMGLSFLASSGTAHTWCPNVHRPNIYIM